MVAKAAAPAKMVKPTATAYKDKSKPADIRHSNINAAKGDFLPISLIFPQFEASIELVSPLKAGTFWF
jgi:hypothetical protein